MTTFLGVPLIIDGQAWGNLYLTEKADGEGVHVEDEQSTVVLSDWASIAIPSRASTGTVRERRDVARAHDARPGDDHRDQPRAGRDGRPEPVLELVVKRSRALIDARAAEISLRDGDDYVLAAVAGDHGDDGGDRIVAPMVFRTARSARSP